MKHAWRAALPWSLSAVVGLLAVYVWGSSFDWQPSAINAYQFFPVLGLLAFSLLWSQYVTTSLQTTLFKNAQLGSYFRYTGYVVLAAIVLHPGLLVYQRFRDGFGLPPGSYESFVAPGMGWITLLGTASLLAFLAFELRRWYGRRPWWKYVVSAGDLAMLAIFYHSLRLGSQLQGGWFRWVWWFYGITLMLILARKYVLLFRSKVRSRQATSGPATRQ